MLPLEWKGDSDDMEIVTEFVFREKLKNRKRYTEINMWPEPESEDDEDEEPEDGQEDYQEDIRNDVTKDNRPGEKKTVEEHPEDEENEEPEDPEEEPEEEQDAYPEDELEHVTPAKPVGKPSGKATKLRKPEEYEHV